MPLESLDALLAEHREADRYFRAAAERLASDEEIASIYQRLTAAVNDILDFRPATIDEVKAKARFLLDLEERGEDDFGKDEMRRLLDSLAT